MMRSRAPAADWILAHRRVWEHKPSLRTVYGRFFAALRAACLPGAPVVEVGCGPGFLKESYPEIVATDVAPNPFADVIGDAAALPLRDAAVGSLVMLDVFHHLPRPEAFLREASRVLRPNGRLVMLEPWMGMAGRFLFRWLHHEECDLNVDPHHPWAGANKDPMLGNAALPYLYFGADGELERAGLPLRVVVRKPFAGLAWVLSAGFQPVGVLPARLVPLAEAVDRLISVAPAVTATRCVIVVEKRPERE
ncbi:MAG TPA: class I SAM-dependent methyltransferase [Candidatus Binatia bacterium]|nr:class I SAM-dependent methyltransferase [Candidatus Binatia bacterium]